jgi:hypothetical protein
MCSQCCVPSQHTAEHSQNILISEELRLKIFFVCANTTLLETSFELFLNVM